MTIKKLKDLACAIVHDEAEIESDEKYGALVRYSDGKAIEYVKDQKPNDYGNLLLTLIVIHAKSDAVATKCAKQLLDSCHSVTELRARLLHQRSSTGGWYPLTVAVLKGFVQCAEYLYNALNELVTSSSTAANELTTQLIGLDNYGRHTLLDIAAYRGSLSMVRTVLHFLKRWLDRVPVKFARTALTLAIEGKDKTPGVESPLILKEPTQYHGIADELLQYCHLNMEGARKFQDMAKADVDMAKLFQDFIDEQAKLQDTKRKLDFMQKRLCEMLHTRGVTLTVGEAKDHQARADSLGCESVVQAFGTYINSLLDVKEQSDAGPDRDSITEAVSDSETVQKLAKYTRAVLEWKSKEKEIYEKICEKIKVIEAKVEELPNGTEQTNHLVDSETERNINRCPALNNYRNALYRGLLSAISACAEIDSGFVAQNESSTSPGASKASKHTHQITCKVQAVVGSTLPPPFSTLMDIAAHFVIAGTKIDRHRALKNLARMYTPHLQSTIAEIALELTKRQRHRLIAMPESLDALSYYGFIAQLERGLQRVERAASNIALDDESKRHQQHSSTSHECLGSRHAQLLLAGLVMEFQDEKKQWKPVLPPIGLDNDAAYFDRCYNYLDSANELCRGALHTPDDRPTELLVNHCCIIS
jgi:hypothetical protein